MSSKAKASSKKTGTAPAPAKEQKETSPVLLVSVVARLIIIVGESFSEMHSSRRADLTSLSSSTTVGLGVWLVWIEYVLQHLQQASDQHDPRALVRRSSSIGGRHCVEFAHVGHWSSQDAQSYFC